MDNQQEWRATLEAAIGEAIDRYDGRIDESDRALPTGQALEIVTAVLWLNASRKDSAASVYATDRLAASLGQQLLAALYYHSK